MAQISGHISQIIGPVIDVLERARGFLGEVDHQFQKLRTVVCIMSRPGAHAVAKRYGHVVLRQDFAYLIEMRI